MTKKFPKKGDPIRIKGSYFINHMLDTTQSLKGKIGFVLKVDVFGEKAMFGKFHKIEGFCCGEIFQAYLEDIEILK